jgi:hypothetical protein
MVNKHMNRKEIIGILVTGKDHDISSTLEQGDPTFFLPWANNIFPAGPKGEKTPLTIFSKTNSQFVLFFFSQYFFRNDKLP